VDLGEDPVGESRPDLRFDPDGSQRQRPVQPLAAARVDAVRAGSPRARKLAVAELKTRLA